MANSYGTIQVMEDRIREEYQRFRNDVTVLQDSARIGELEKNVAKLHNIVKEALSAGKFHGWTTGQKAFLETTLHGTRRIDSVIKSARAEDRRSRVIFFEAESASKKRYRSTVEIDDPVPIKMTEQDKKDYESTNICHLCERGIVDPSDKVADHNHRGKGAYRGVAD
ncbi:hypothetical protein QAD02_018135 [Eretmocerus hayati]|uniref:Uncharacterized protein n=1 Tax=Eretmocerus hayati TaxID=131215 RepID=A0ACC2PFX5_9HYME|nr:hypothetical protein QAD02_018135 [Eretmocerus hayati]